MKGFKKGLPKFFLLICGKPYYQVVYKKGEVIGGLGTNFIWTVKGKENKLGILEVDPILHRECERLEIRPFLSTKHILSA